MVKCVLTILVLQIAALGGAGVLAEGVFQCQPTSDPSGQIYTPNIPDSFFNHENVAALSTGPTLDEARNGFTYFFTLPPESPDRNCSGTVKALEFCYHAELKNNEIGDPQDIFEFLMMTREDFLFTVTSRFDVQATSSASNCVVGNKMGPNTPHDCCISVTLPSQLQIPSSSYTFGVRIIDNDIKPFAFRGSVQEFRVEQFQTAASGENFTLGEGDRVTDNALLLLRFLLEPPVTEAPVTPPPTTVPAPTLAATTLTQQSTPIPESTAPTMPTTQAATSTAAQDGSEPSIPVTADLPQSTGQQSSTTGDGIEAVNSDSPPSPGSSTGVAVGGAVGGVIVGLLVGVSVIALCVALVIGKRGKLRSEAKHGRDATAMENAMYEGVGSGHDDNDYAGIGPHISTATGTGKPLDASDCYYAECGAMSYETPSILIDLAYEQPVGLKTDLSNPMYEEGSVPWKDEDIYMVPATDEDTLYTQLQSMLTQSLTRESVKLNSLLGSGQFGTVYKGVLESGDEEVEVAVKTLKEGSGEEDRVKFLQEAAIMGQFKHHNVVTIYGVVTQGEPILLVLELLSKGDLREYLLKMRSDKESLDDHTLLSYCRQVASGMAYLSSKAFVHRDLAARNILVSDDEICKIADFGMSRDLQENYYVSQGGKIPVKWTAPEAIYYKKYSTASDVWSYGILMYEIWSLGVKPYQKSANNKVMKLVDTGYRLPPPPGCPHAIYTIMMSCWHPGTSGRPSFQELTRQLSLPDTKLLKWSEEDKSIHPEAAQLGADLLCGEELYKDLQILYKGSK